MTIQQLNGTHLQYEDDADKILFDTNADYLSTSDKNLIRRAYEVARTQHADQKRASGEPYITHCLAVAKQLMDMQMNGEVIAAGLLHDVSEDTPYSIQEIQENFGEVVARLVDAVTKLKQPLDFEDREVSDVNVRKEKERLENLRRMFMSFAKDERAVAIKLADRLHNMRTLQYKSEAHKRIRTARETMDLFAPLANRLGFHLIRCELEDLSFRYLQPQDYDQIVEQLNSRTEEIQDHLSKFSSKVQAVLNENGMAGAYRLSFRRKHIYGIYRKMRKKDVRDIESIYDIKALRVIVEKVSDCYQVLGILHTNWIPVTTEFDDYIAAPKPNGYSSLHTVLRDIYNNRTKYFEVQIRTEKMHRQAEHGDAAYWVYKEQLKSKDPQVENYHKNRRFRQEVEEVGEDTENADEFVDIVKDEVLATDEKVYVYTPQGDIIDLPLGSTPIDFAYCIHTEVGHTCRGAHINGKYVALNYQLQDGDIVEIKTEKRGGPSRDWLNENLGYVRTNRARRKIKHWFKRQNYPDNVRQGREMLEKELKRLGIRELNWEQLAHKLKYNTLDDFLAAVGYNDISLQQVIRIVQELVPDFVQPTKKSSPRSTQFDMPSTHTEGVIVQGVGDLLTTLANCCHPIPGEPIVGFVTRNRGVTIHRKDCTNVNNSNQPERRIFVEWQAERPATYVVYIVVSAFDRQALTRDITDVLAREKINIVNLSVDTYPEENMAAIYLSLEITDLQQLQRVMDQMEQVPNVFDVHRKG